MVTQFPYYSAVQKFDMAQVLMETMEFVQRKNWVFAVGKLFLLMIRMGMKLDV